MGRLIYAAIASLDGYVADADGSFESLAPSAEVHAFVNELTRPIGTHLLGRSMYEVMSAWETMDVTAELPAIRDFAEIWRGSEKVVFSRTLSSVATERSRLEREFDPSEIRELKTHTELDIAVGGPTLAAEAFRAELVDEIQLFLVPVVFGGGKRALPDDLHLDLELVDERRFANGTVHLRYRAKS
jgi:dihydrofolate reductase